MRFFNVVYFFGSSEEGKGSYGAHLPARIEAEDRHAAYLKITNQLQAPVFIIESLNSARRSYVIRSASVNYVEVEEPEAELSATAWEAVSSPGLLSLSKGTSQGQGNS